jgi:hypothetical protein
MAGCAPAPLYTSGGLHRGAATWGEIPRDARGEPVWAAIRPVPADVTTQVAAVPPRGPAAVQEGDGEEPSMPPKE